MILSLQLQVTRDHKLSADYSDQVELRMVNMPASKLSPRLKQIRKEDICRTREKIRK
jgi:hypothetical protein